MDPLQEILLTTLEIITLCCGLAGMALCLGLALLPPGASAAARLMNRKINVENGLVVLDRYYYFDRFFFRHNILTGSLFVTGSLFAAAFLFIGIEFDRLTETFILLADQPLLNESLLSAMVLTGKVATACGILLGLVLILAPKKVESVTKAMDSSLSTRELVERLNTYHYGFDHLVYRFPRLFGTLGFVASSVLVFLSILNMSE